MQEMPMIQVIEVLKKNEREAFNWFLKAANNENYDLGQYYLARCYEFGIKYVKIFRMASKKF